MKLGKTVNTALQHRHFARRHRQHRNLATPAAPTPSAVAMNRIAGHVCAVSLMLLAADLRPQRRLDVGDVRLMMIACVNQI